MFLGRVVGDIDNDVINFTLQKEIAAFPKGWLHKVELQEPAAPYPLGSKSHLKVLYTNTL